jgi:hypothetical protein
MRRPALQRRQVRSSHAPSTARLHTPSCCFEFWIRHLRAANSIDQLEIIVAVPAEA